MGKVQLVDSSGSPFQYVGGSGAQQLFAGNTPAATHVPGLEKYDTDWGAPAPVRETFQTWLARAPAGAYTDGTPKRRSEVWLACDGSGVYGYEGDMLLLDAYFTPQLGPTAQESTWGNWAVVAQVHGPPKDLSQPWNPAAMLISAKEQRFWLSGGDGHPVQMSGGSGYIWEKDLGPLVDGQRTRIRLLTLLSEDPSVGWVSAWRDGRQILDQWQPVGSGGNKPGTLPNKAWVANRVGLYRGTGAGSLPTADQTVRVTVVQAHGSAFGAGVEPPA